MGATTHRIGLAFAILAAILNFVSFVSPYWMVSDPRANNQFQRIGLWEACLKDFVDPKDYVSKLYNGCWWIFWPEYAEIRYWLNPPWFQGLQALATFSFISIIVGAIMVFPGSNRVGICLVASSFLLSGIDAILFGMGSIDRTWMPKIDFNYLSWAYWLHVLGGFFAFISTVSLICNRMAEEDDFDQSEKPVRKAY